MVIVRLYLFPEVAYPTTTLPQLNLMFVLRWTESNVAVPDVLPPETFPLALTKLMPFTPKFPDDRYWKPV